MDYQTEIRTKEGYRLQRKITQGKAGGSITAYLTLILLIILSLLLTIMEGARVSTAKVFAERALSSSMDSVLAEFYGPLWEEYHILGYQEDDSSITDKSQAIADKLSEYMSYTFYPKQGLESNAAKRGLELYSIGINSVSALDRTLLVDYQGGLYINEAVEYMKYHEVADGAKLLLDKLSLLETPRKVSAIYDKKLTAEEELAKMEKDTLKLMKLLDGVHTSDKGIEPDREGRLQTEDYYVKMICPEPVTMETAGVNNSAVFQVLRDRYINPAKELTETKNDISYLSQTADRLANLEEALAFNSSELQAAEANLEELQMERAGLLEEREEQMFLKQRLISSITASLDRVQTVAHKLVPLIEDARTVIEHSRRTASQAENIWKDYESVLEQQKEGLQEDILNELQEGLMRMKQFAFGNEGGSFSEMLTVLERNKKLLQTMEEQVGQCRRNLQEGAYQAAGGYLDTAAASLNSYSIHELKLDFSTLVLDHAKAKNPADELGRQWKHGLSGLIIDPDTVSDQILSQNQLPSAQRMVPKDSNSFSELLTELINQFAKGQEDSAAQKLFLYFNDSTQLMNALGDTATIISEQLLFQEYLKEHFEMYPVQGEDITNRKPSALAYEQEYLLAGKEADAENLESVLSKIVLIRMITDFVSLLGNKACQAEALAAATAMVGFTGFPILINITKTALLLLWAFSEALVDTCGLLMGREVPLIKNKIVLTFPELFLINRDFLKTKAAQLENAKLSLGYQDYLGLFRLLMPKDKLAYRSMDLIQENINLRYEDTFLFRNCLYGFQAEAEFTIAARFLTIPFLRKYINQDIAGFRFSAKAEYSY